MANVKFQRQEIEKHIKLSSDVIEKIQLLGIPIEYINEKEIEIEVLPNRPDLLSIHGFIRALKSFIGKEKGLNKYTIHKPEKDYKIVIEKDVKDIRPYTVCAIAKNLSLNNEKIKELIDLQEKLHSTIGRKRKKAAIGIYPLNKIKLPITYTAISPEKIKFKPLESNEEMTAKEILERTPIGKEYSNLLENLERYPIFIDKKNNILSMPPIVNSEETGRITEETKEVFIECSGSDLNILKKILNIIVTTLADMGAEIYAMELSYGKDKIMTPDLKPETIKISLGNVNKILGLNLKEKDLENLLPKMQYNYTKGKLEIPSWRIDILHEVDIIEDIAIAYGYNNFIPEIPTISTIGFSLKETNIESKLSEILVGLGLTEVSSYHLIKTEEKEKMKIENIIELENSKTEYKFLRPNLLIPALRILSENKDNEYPQKIFEIGKVFSKSAKTETSILEKKNLAIAISHSNFTEIKQILDYISKILNFQYSIKELSHNNLIEGRAGMIIVNNKQIGCIGDMHPKTLNEWKVQMPVSIIELELEEIYQNF